MRLQHVNPDPIGRPQCKAQERSIVEVPFSSKPGSDWPSPVGSDPPSLDTQTPIFHQPAKLQAARCITAPEILSHRSRYKTLHHGGR